MVTRLLPVALDTPPTAIANISDDSQDERSFLYRQRDGPALTARLFWSGASMPMTVVHVRDTGASGLPPHSRHVRTPSADAGDIHPPQVQRIAQRRPHRSGLVDGHLVHRAPEHLGARLAERVPAVEHQPSRHGQDLALQSAGLGAVHVEREAADGGAALSATGRLDGGHGTTTVATLSIAARNRR